MANRTDPSAKSIRGTDPQNLIEKIVRTKIHNTTYWKEQCQGLTAETLVDKAVELDHIGGTFGGNRKPTPFICLVDKMLQIQPEKEIVAEFIRNEDHRYVRALGAFYLRLTGTDADVYGYLEPLYYDYRKLRMRSSDGKFIMTNVDVFVDELLTKDYSCDIVLPHIKKRRTLESLGSLQPRRSALEDEFEEDEEKKDEAGATKDYYLGDRERKRDRHDCDREREYDRGRRRRHSSDERRRRHSRSRSRSRERDEGRRRRNHRRREVYDDSDIRDEPRKKKERKEKKDDGTDHPDPEIAEANRLRASVGLKPLRL